MVVNVILKEISVDVVLPLRDLNSWTYLELLGHMSKMLIILDLNYWDLQVRDIILDL